MCLQTNFFPFATPLACIPSNGQKNVVLGFVAHSMKARKSLWLFKIGVIF